MVRIFRSVAGALLATCLALPALAQTPVPGPGGGTLVPFPQATATHLACARSLVAASGLSRSFLSLIPDMMRQVNLTVTRTRPELINDMKTTLDQLQPEFLRYTDEVTDAAARIYTALLNEQECKDALAFFSTPAGKKYVDMQPSVFANISPVMESWNKQISVRMYDRVREELKKKGHEF